MLNHFTLFFWILTACAALSHGSSIINSAGQVSNSICLVCLGWNGSQMASRAYVSAEHRYGYNRRYAHPMIHHQDIPKEQHRYSGLLRNTPDYQLCIIWFQAFFEAVAIPGVTRGPRRALRPIAWAFRVDDVKREP
jgi:hypothetical protein